MRFTPKFSVKIFLLEGTDCLPRIEVATPDPMVDLISYEPGPGALNAKDHIII